MPTIIFLKFASIKYKKLEFKILIGYIFYPLVSILPTALQKEIEKHVLDFKLL
jgi:hypothetical protein